MAAFPSVNTSILFTRKRSRVEETRISYPRIVYEGATTAVAVSTDSKPRRAEGRQVARSLGCREGVASLFIGVRKSLPLALRRSTMGFQNRNRGPRTRLSGKDRLNGYE